MNSVEAALYFIFYVFPLFLQFLNEGHAWKYACLSLCMLYRILYIVLYYRLNSKQGLLDLATKELYDSGCCARIRLRLRWLCKTFACENGVKFLVTTVYIILRFLDPDPIKAPNDLQNATWNETRQLKLLLWTLANIILMYLIVIKFLEFLRASDTFSAQVKLVKLGLTEIAPFGCFFLGWLVIYATVFVL